MPYVVVRNFVEDFDSWKAFFDRSAATRRAAGSTGTYLLRDAEDRNFVTMMVKFNELDEAHAFAYSEHMQESLKRADAKGPYDFYFAEEIGRSPA